MFLKIHRVRKDGKEHFYYSLCESLRCRKGQDQDTHTAEPVNQSANI